MELRDIRAERDSRPVRAHATFLHLAVGRPAAFRSPPLGQLALALD